MAGPILAMGLSVPRRAPTEATQGRSIRPCLLGRCDHAADASPLHFFAKNNETHPRRVPDLTALFRYGKLKP
jgi:hypothetical protein